MENSADYVGLVRRAQLGDKGCLEQLTEVVNERLRVDMYRLTLEHELAQEIVQETMLEMLKVLSELKEVEKFWPWLYQIALNRVRLHYRRKRRRRSVPLSSIPEPAGKDDGREAMANMVSGELKEIVLGSMRALKTEHRAVLTMRCYREMRYSAIAESMGCSEFAAKMLFCRAKKALKRQLARRGFSKGSLLPALVLFGKLTAPSEAAKVSIGPASVKVGAGAAIAGAVAGKKAVICLLTAGLLGLGGVYIGSGIGEKIAGPAGNDAAGALAAERAEMSEGGIEECWYYFPGRADSPVMMQMMRSDPKEGWSCCSWRQNEIANYYCDNRKKTIYIRNCRVWRGDLSVWRLPTDGARLREFLCKVEGRGERAAGAALTGRGTLIVERREVNGGGDQVGTIRHHHILDGAQFRYNWPAGYKVVDERDAMHKRGWTYFRISGRIKGKAVSGTGCIPFVYGASRRHRAWMRVRVGSKVVVDESFVGFCRPWMGLHTIDTIRRDAAEEGIWFETQCAGGGEKAEVSLSCEGARVVYTIDMHNDITMRAAEDSTAELNFSYLQEIVQPVGDFAEPTGLRVRGKEQRKEGGILWLVKLLRED